MGRDILYTPGVGGRAGADEVTIDGQLVKVQELKLAAGKVGEYIGDVGGALVDGDTNRSALFVRERPDVREFTPTVTVNTAAYTAGNCIGGKITVANAVAVAGNVLRLHRLFAVTKVDTGGITFYVFDDDPSATTFTDHAAFPTIADADLPKLRYIATLGSNTDGSIYYIRTSRARADDMPDFPLVGTSLYLAMKVTATPDFVASSDFKLLSLVAERL